jgi:hypothetical protein
LILLAQIPPEFVVLARARLARKDFPAPLIYQIAEGQEGDFIQRHLHQQRNVGARVRRFVNQTELFQVFRRDRQRNRVADGFVKPSLALS